MHTKENLKGYILIIRVKYKSCITMGIYSRLDSRLTSNVIFLAVCLRELHFRLSKATVLEGHSQISTKLSIQFDLKMRNRVLLPIFGKRIPLKRGGGVKQEINPKKQMWYWTNISYIVSFIYPNLKVGASSVSICEEKESNLMLDLITNL